MIKPKRYFRFVRFMDYKSFRETGCEHLAQAAWNALTMLYFSHKNDK